MFAKVVKIAIWKPLPDGFISGSRSDCMQNFNILLFNNFYIIYQSGEARYVRPVPDAAVCQV